ncbi:MAG: thiolase family protein [Bacteroidetes bacterium]|nr:thiolase family protein [Bacteroidota bacterium]
MEAYIIDGYRSAIGKANKGGFRFTRPDDIATHVIKHLMAQNQLQPEQIDDLIVGNAVPEAEQGLQIGRMIALQALGKDVPGMVVNRYCASGLETVGLATSKIKTGMADIIIAGGTESMSLVPTVGWKTVPNYKVAATNPDYYFSMGLTAEAVANDFNVSREAQDEFSFHSHRKALNAIESGRFAKEIVPIEVEEVYVENDKKQSRKFTVGTDEGPRQGTSVEALAKLRPVFANKGTVTAGNSSQTSDGAAFLIIASEQAVKEHNLTPIAKLTSYVSAGVDPRIMGIGPVNAVPKALKRANLSLNDIDLIELNEAFASQSIAVINELGLNPEIVNVNGGAIALGHPLGATGARLSLTIIHELKQRGKKRGLVTACVGGGQGIAGVIEIL